MRHASIEQSSSGFTLLVDGVAAKTPLGKNIILPNAPLAEAIAEEWRAQDKIIHKETMPFTRMACVAIDLIRERRDEACADLLAYCDTDVLCYRVGDIPELLAQQSSLLDPLIAWATQRFSIELSVTHGIMPVIQKQENKAKIVAAIAAYNEWQFTVFATLVKPLCSLILSLAVMEKYIGAEQAFHLSHLEEIYETEKWGKDEEKETKMQVLKREIIAAEKFLGRL